MVNAAAATSGDVAVAVADDAAASAQVRPATEVMV
jgi:hypothetical protein